MSEPILLRSKLLVPRFAPAHLPRPHLVEMVRGLLDHRLIVLSAPAGYGKTTLAAEATAAIKYPVLWYQLDANDNDPSTFLAYLVEGLCQTLPRIGKKVRQFLLGSGPYPPERTLIAILNELVEQPSQDWILVLDDYHFIVNPAIHRLMTTLLEHRPVGMHVLLPTRNHPPLPLARWRARGQLAEIREEHLRFSAQEVLEWMGSSNYRIPGTVAETLVEKTEGWGAGIQLVMSLLPEAQVDPTELVERINGEHPYIFNYLMEEVFDYQTPPVQNFLLHSAILSQLNADICRVALELPDAEQILKTLESDNLFLVALDDQSYRYHPLFREFLLKRLTSKSPETLRRLQLAAATYYRDRNQFEAATQYFLSAGSLSDAALSLRGFAATFLNQGRLDVLSRYLRVLGTNFLREYPDLLLIYGCAQRGLGALSDAIAYLEQVLTLSTTSDHICTAFTELASIARSQGDYIQAQRLAKRAAETSTSASPSVRAFALMELAKCEGFLEGMDKGRLLAEQAVSEMRNAGDAISLHNRAQLLRSLGQICWWHGDVIMAVAHCEEALRMLPDATSPLAAEILVTLATPCLYRHEYQAALRYGEQALAIAERMQLKELLPAVFTVLGNTLTRIGQLIQAETYLRNAIEFASSIGAASYDQVMAGGYLAYNLVAQSRVEEARQVAETALFPFEGRSTVYEVYVCRSVQADINLSTGYLREAAQTFQELIDLGESRQYRIPLAMAYFGLAYILLTEGNQSTGGKLAKRSLDLISSPQVWELYVDQGQRAKIVCEYLKHLDPDNSFVALVLHALSKQQSSVSIMANQASRIQVRTLGSLRVYYNDQEIESRAWTSAKARDLFAYFVTYRREYIPIDRVVDALWALDAQHSKAAFHTALYRTRQALNTLMKRGDAKFILSGAGDYHLEAMWFDIDTDAFDGYLKQARLVSPEEAAGCYKAAIELYQGEYLENLYADWLLPERNRLAHDYMQALQALENYYSCAGHFDEALTLARQSLSVDPLAEHIHRNVMYYLYEMGNRSALIKHYSGLCSLLHVELGVDPLPETQALFLRLSSSP